MQSTIKRFFLGFVKIHILHHAVKEPVYGVWLMGELNRHGYHIGPGTLYPILHSLQAEGLIKFYQETAGGKIRKYYRTTALGRKILREARKKIGELMEEVLEDKRG